MGRKRIKSGIAMLCDWELWACAQHYVSEHGEDAGLAAAMRCDQLLDACDYEGDAHVPGNHRAHQPAARAAFRFVSLGVTADQDRAQLRVRLPAAVAFREHPGFPRFSSLLVVDFLTSFGENVIRERRGGRKPYVPALLYPQQCHHRTERKVRERHQQEHH